MAHDKHRTAAIAAAALLAAGAPWAQAAPPFIYSPYKHLAMWNDPATNVITAAPDGVRTPYINGDGSPFGRQALTWAFASGECGDEQWGTQRGQDVADANVAAFDRAGIRYLISTGGQGAVFTCASAEGMERFVARYDSPHLAGIDFDIEAGQSAQQIASLLAAAASVQAHRPALRFSLTVPTHAASDGSLRSLNETGVAVLAAAQRSGLRDYALNLMVMDYGPAHPNACVVRARRCQMGLSAIQAARNVHRKYGVPYEQIELTAMIGVNDVRENVFTVADARTVAQAARRMKLAGLHFWSLDRDTPCPVPTIGAQATCSSMPGTPGGAYGRAFTTGLGSGDGATASSGQP
ncbi:glycosyl hydrolase [Duganella sp. LX20W]|uniref:Glycosyl hydrolase n=1 Tax=Rugamonas brunnea TaxID=2758569 RepID=A0A7W2IB55_9BURK|nr:glycosyl hydrolase [Rugamonas brunnea]MBA5636989.1 glycosyl hydrolase [Rugamonas brunnea]